MSGIFDAVDLSLLPPPITDKSTFDGILLARMQAYISEWDKARAIDPSLPAYDVQMMETDVVKRAERTDAFREVLKRQQINEAKASTFLAWAQGDDLTNRLADVHLTPAVDESPASQRRRAQLAFEALAAGGTYGGYLLSALSAAPADIGDLVVYGHEIEGVPKGEVHIVVMGAGANPAPSQSLLNRIMARFPRNPAADAMITASQPPVYLVAFPDGAPIKLTDAAAARVLAQVGNPGRKVNDLIVARGPNVRPYVIDAELVIKSGADPALVVSAQRAALISYTNARQTIAGLVSPAHIDGQLVTNSAGLVVDCVRHGPAQAIGGGPFDVPLLTGVSLTWRRA